MIRFEWLRSVLAAVAAVVVVALVGACGAEEVKAPEGAVLPSDFPTAQIPLIDGTVLSATGSRTQGWVITMQGPAAGGNQLDQAVKKLADNGFTESQRTSTGGQSLVVLTGKKDKSTYWVQVGASRQAAAGASSVIYQISVS